ncbi:MAG: S41 family peptidase [Parachlamydiaceae bacterium]|nr:S41 family peptidase [Parachlamydiaceae bacterium]
MMVSKYDIQLFMDNTPQHLILYDSGDGETDAISINGRHYALAEENVPTAVIQLFHSLRGKTFSSDEELLKNLESSLLKVGAIGLSFTKEIYKITKVGTAILLNKEQFESESVVKLKHNAFINLKDCDPADEGSIAKAVKTSNCSPRVLFDVADQIEKLGKASLANAIRRQVRPFNLEYSVEGICKQVSAHYFNDATVKQIVEYLLGKFKEGKYDKIWDVVEFAKIVTKDLQEISGDGHFELLVKDKTVQKKESTPKEEASEIAAKRLKELQAENFGFGKLENLGEGVYLLQINSMSNPKEAFEGRFPALEKAKGIMEALKKAQPATVIFDLRENYGGSNYMTELLCSYFNKPDITLSGFSYKTPPTDQEKNVFPTEPCKTWGEDVLPQEERMLDTPLYLLTSNRTFSAAEDLIFHLKGLERATVVGETTGGGSNITKLFDVGEDFHIGIPIGSLVLPYGENWDGSGVEPHVHVQAEKAQEKAVSLIALRKR